MQLFWERGYEMVSISQLTQAMGINPPSLYSAFTDKRTLFEEAVQSYADRFGGYIDHELDDARGAREAVERFLVRAAEQCTLPDHPPGCLILSGDANHSDTSADVAAGLRERRAHVESRIATLIEADAAVGRLPAATDVQALAAYATTVWKGLSPAARDGHSRTTLMTVVARAMDAWPQPEHVTTAHHGADT